MNKHGLFKFLFGCEPCDIKSKVIITPVIPLKKIEKLIPSSKHFRGKMYAGFTCKEKDISVINCGIGDRLLGDAVILLKESGVREIIFLGTAGGIRPCGIGDIIAAEKSFNGEGFSRYFTKDFSLESLELQTQMKSANNELLDDIIFFSGTINMPEIKRGKIFTIGSILAETSDLIKRLEEKAFQAIEMELSAFYTAAKYAGIKAAGLLAISDIPFERDISGVKSDEERERFIHGLDAIIKLSLSFFDKGEHYE